VGAVIVVADQSQQQTVGGGHGGGKALPLHFGLGDVSEVTIKVTWPDGSNTTHQAAANQAIEITR